MQPFGVDSITAFSDFVPWVDYAEDGSVQQLHFIQYNKLTNSYVARTVTREMLEVATLADTASVMTVGSPISYRQLVFAFWYAEQWRTEAGEYLKPHGCPDLFDRLGFCHTQTSCYNGWGKSSKLGNVLDAAVDFCKGLGGGSGGGGGSSGSTSNPPTVIYIPTGSGVGSSGSGSLGTASSGGSGGGRTKYAYTTTMAFRCDLQRCGWGGLLGTLQCTASIASALDDDISGSGDYCRTVNNLYHYGSPGGFRSYENLGILEAIVIAGLGELVAGEMQKFGISTRTTAYEKDIIDYYLAVGPSNVRVRHFGKWKAFVARVKAASAVDEAELSGEDYAWLLDHEQEVLTYAEANRGKFGNYSINNLVDYVRLGKFRGNVAESLKQLDLMREGWTDLVNGVNPIALFPLTPQPKTISLIASASAPSVNDKLIIWQDRGRVNPQDLRVDGPLDKVGRGPRGTTGTFRDWTTEERLSDFRDLLNFFTFNGPNAPRYRQVADRYRTTFTAPQSKVIDTHDDELNQLLLMHPSTLNYIHEIANFVTSKVQNGEDVRSLYTALPSRIFRPIYNKNIPEQRDRWQGPTILLNDTEAARIRLQSVQETTDKKIINLHLTIIDHFGLDEEDMLAYRMFHRGFESWYWLQHGLDYHPFRTNLYYTISISVPK